MKFMTTSFLLALSINTFACPDIAGKFLCPEEAAQEYALGSREIAFKYSSLVNMFTSAIGSEVLLFEVGAFNPAINPNTGEIDYSVMTKATCSTESVTLRSEVTQGAGQESITLTGDAVITPNAQGVNFKMVIMGDEMFAFDCKRI